jgi:hypothetical protein
MKNYYEGDDLLSHRYLLFCTIVAPSFAIIALYKQSGFPEKEPEAVMKAIFPKGCSPNVILPSLAPNVLAAAFPKDLSQKMFNKHFCITDFEQ